MIALVPFLLASCLAVNSVSDRILAADLAPAFPGLRAVAPETPLALAPAPGVVRTFHPSELRRIAERWGVLAPDEDICIERPVAPLNPQELLGSMQRALPGASIEILEFAGRPAPVGQIEFPATGLHTAAGSTMWNGWVVYGGAHKFPIWARVRVRINRPCVTALRDLLPGQPVPAEAIQLESREQGPENAGCAQSSAMVAGKWPRLRIRAGSAILMAQLSDPKDVVQGETVHVAVHDGAARLEMKALAEGSGMAGETIRVRNPVSQKLFTARVIGRDRVSVELGGKQ